MDNFSLTRHVRHRTIGSWELASRSTEEGWGNALSGARSVDTATTQLGKTSRTKNLITKSEEDMIEKDYDVSFVAAMALREKQIQQNYRPVIAVHKWFARRPGTLFRSLLLSEFTGRPISENYYQ